MKFIEFNIQTDILWFLVTCIICISAVITVYSMSFATNESPDKTGNLSVYIDNVSKSNYRIGENLTDIKTKANYQYLDANNDSDGDGLPDKYEASRKTTIQSNLSPHYKDIVINVRSRRNKIPSEFILIEKQFAAAPIPNPNGSTGINLHFYTALNNLTVVDRKILDSNHKYTMYPDIFYQLIIVDEIPGNRVVGVTSTSTNVIVIENTSDGRILASRLMHELGHQLGLSQSDFNGIDSTEYSYSSYESTMNYICKNQKSLLKEDECGIIRYSKSKPFDDWSHINQTLSKE